MYRLKGTCVLSEVWHMRPVVYFHNIPLEWRMRHFQEQRARKQILLLSFIYKTKRILVTNSSSEYYSIGVLHGWVSSFLCLATSELIDMLTCYSACCSKFPMVVVWPSVTYAAQVSIITWLTEEVKYRTVFIDFCIGSDIFEQNGISCFLYLSHDRVSVIKNL